MVDVSKLSQFRLSRSQFQVSRLCGVEASSLGRESGFRFQLFKITHFRIAELETRTPKLFLPVAGPHYRLNVAANVEVAFDLHAQGIARTSKVFQDHIDYVLMEYLDVAKRVDIELETL